MSTELSALANVKPTFMFERDGIPEVAVGCLWAFKDADGKNYGNALSTPIVARSLLKPWQFLAHGLEMKDKRWLLGIASHSGEEFHLRTLHELAAEEGIPLEHLQCPASYPMWEEAAWRMRLGNIEQQPQFHNCSGKHLTYLIHCKKVGWDHHYIDHQHPIHDATRKTLADYGAVEQRWMIDGCLLPALAVPMDIHLKMWRELATRGGSDPQVGNMLELWRHNPEYVGGTTRLDAWVVKSSGGRVVAKEGADGLIFVQSLNPKNPQGVMIKLASGHHQNYLALGLYTVLKSLQSRLDEDLAMIATQLETRVGEWVPRQQVYRSLL